MKKFTNPLTKKDLTEIRNQYGDYFKSVIDINQEILIVGCELHADGAEVLLSEDNSKDENVWGGAIDLNTKEIYYSAVYNIRPRFNNNSMEILNANIRERFGDLSKNFFKVLFNE